MYLWNHYIVTEHSNQCRSQCRAARFWCDVPFLAIHKAAAMCAELCQIHSHLLNKRYTKFIALYLLLITVTFGFLTKIVGL